MKTYKVRTKSVRETSAVAKRIAADLGKSKNRKNAVVMGLFGELGAGKTTFIKSLVRGLGNKSRVVSPTFILMRSFPAKKPYRKIYHVDAYRVSEKSLRQLGLKDIIRDPENIVLIEWADRVKKLLPKDSILVDIKHGKNRNERHFTINRR